MPVITTMKSMNTTKRVELNLDVFYGVERGGPDRRVTVEVFWEHGDYVVREVKQDGAVGPDKARVTWADRKMKRAKKGVKTPENQFDVSLEHNGNAEAPIMVTMTFEA